MTLAIVLVLLVLGSVLFHFLSPWWFTPIASNWGSIDDTIAITFWVTGFVFVAVNLFLAYCVVRYRHNNQRRAHYEPENRKLEWWLTGLTTVGIVAMLAPGLFVWGKVIDVPEDAMVVEALGQQWQWRYRFPGEDGELGAVDPRLMDDANPYGIAADDPNSADDIVVDQPVLHLPVDRPVKVLLRSRDVLHNFAVPQFRVKMDLVPGMVTYVWLTPTRTGTFEVLCQELCGIAHHAMRGKVVVQSQEEFDQWLAQQPRFAEIQERPDPDPKAGEQRYAVCVSCHGQNGEGNPQMNSPNLTGLSAQYMVRQLQYFKQGVRGAHEDDTYGQQMAPMAATLADRKAIADVAAYIEEMPSQPTEKTVSGNVRRGDRLYTTCGVCHGKSADGNTTLNAPALAGLDDWYLVTQLKNFKQGVRGSHPDDAFGEQMKSMANILTDEEDIKDLVAYINTL